MGKYTYEYPRPSVSADCLVLALEDGKLKLLLINRGNDPYKGFWALPGGFLDGDENLDVAAKRELQEETGLTNVSVEQLYAFGDVGRDPRARVIAIAYMAMVRMKDHNPQAADDAVNAKWFSIKRPPKLAFDHRLIVKHLLDRMRIQLRCQPLGLELLPDEFALSELQNLFEIIAGKKLDGRSFKSQIMKSELLVKRQKGKFRFDKRKYKAAQKSGLTFQF